MERGLDIFNPWVDSCSLPSDKARSNENQVQDKSADYVHVYNYAAAEYIVRYRVQTEYRAMSNFKKHLELSTLLRMAKSSLNKCGPS